MKSEMPVAPISVIVPCYRCAGTIERALESVYRQTLQPAEIVLVDDCSGDGTLARLHQLAAAGPGRIRVLPMETNMGAASARNAGWEAAAQPYIAFLDADDSWHADKLRAQYGYMTEHPEVALTGHQCVWLREDETPPEITPALGASDIKARSLLFKSPFSTPTVMIKRALPFRFQEGKRCAEDLLLWQRVAFGGLKVARIESLLAFVHKPLYGAGGMSAQLWKMEQGELDNLIVLRRENQIGPVVFGAAYLFSFAKFLRRLLITRLRSAGRANSIGDGQ